MVGFTRQGWPGYGMGNGGIMSSGYGGSPPAYQVCTALLEHLFLYRKLTAQIDDADFLSAWLPSDAVRAIRAQPPIQQRRAHAAHEHLRACRLRLHGQPAPHAEPGSLRMTASAADYVLYVLARSSRQLAASQHPQCFKSICCFGMLKPQDWATLALAM